MKILSIEIGNVKEVGDKNAKDFINKAYRTGSYKIPVTTPVKVSKAGIEGDFVADTLHHGGEDKAVFANSFKNYAKWSEFLGRDDLEFGALAENITFEDIDETDVCIGDVHKIGSVILEVSQPRKPCWKISRKWQNKEFTKHIFDTGKTGWYYRVLQEGEMNKNDSAELVKRLDTLVSIQEANDAFKDPSKHKDTAAKLLEMDVLASAWKKGLQKRIKNKNEILGYMQIK